MQLRNNPYGYFMGNRQIMKAILNSSKSLMFNPTEKLLVLGLGNIIVGVFGYPFQIIRRNIRVFLSRFLDNNQIDINSKVLDVGCGLGYDAFSLALKYGCSVIGTDVDKTSVEIAKSIKQTLKAENVQIQLDNILKSKIQEQFDLVLFLEVLEHIKDHERALCEISKRLKQKGLLILATPYSDDAHDFAEPTAAFHLKQKLPRNAEEFVGGFHWRNGYSKARLTGLLEKQGFTVLEANYLKLPSIMSRVDSVAFLFPLIYPMSRVLSYFSGTRIALIVKAQKN